MDASAFLTNTLRASPRGDDVAAVLSAGIAAADPDTAVRRHLQRSDDQLTVGTRHYDLAQMRRVFVLAIGKAAVPMARAALDVLGPFVVGGLVVSKADRDSQPPASVGILPHLATGHPVPDERSLAAGQRTIALLKDTGVGDLVVVLLSGGGSALITCPADDLTLADMRALTDVLLASGATINEMNALRRSCDRVKGGGLLRAASAATVAVLVLSDVLGDDLRSIASGPFVTGDDSRAVEKIIDRYRLRSRLAPQLLAVLDRVAAPPPVDSVDVTHTIIANVEAAVTGAVMEAQARGFRTDVLATNVQGEARLVGQELAQQLLDAVDLPRPFCLVSGGETTVTLRGSGLGGRNQELALAAVETLAGHADLLLVALATDGGDGPTDAAGAVVSGETLARGQALGLDPRAFLDRNDAYHYFDPLGDLLRPGQTGTNVNDLTLLFAL